jgi:hypothetical protein
MKSLKPLFCAIPFALCSVAASTASAASISPEGPFSTNAGLISVKSPSSFGAAVTCGIAFSGNVSSGVARIYNVNTTGGGQCFMQPVVVFPPWVLTAGPATTVTITNVSYKISSIPATNCGPTTIQVSWDPVTKTLIGANQPLSGNCTVVSLKFVAPSLTVNP